MTDPSPTAPAVSPVERWKLTEPVLLYLWPVCVFLIVGGLVVEFVVGEYWGGALGIVGGLLTAAGAAAARASVFSPRSVVQTAIRARQ
jgi:hypothetical protein